MCCLLHCCFVNYIAVLFTVLLFTTLLFCSLYCCLLHCCFVHCIVFVYYIVVLFTVLLLFTTLLFCSLYCCCLLHCCFCCTSGHQCSRSGQTSAGHEDTGLASWVGDALHLHRCRLLQKSHSRVVHQPGQPYLIVEYRKSSKSTVVYHNIIALNVYYT